MKVLDRLLKNLPDRYLLLLSFLINSFFFLIVLLLLTPAFGLDDVYVMLAASGFYTGEPSEYLLISNILFGKALQWLYQYFPVLNWYGYILTGLNFLCMTILLFLLMKLLKSWISLIIFLLLFLVFGIEFYIRLHYTFIAFLCGFTSLFLLLFYAPPTKIYSKSVYFTVVVILFVMAFLIRKESFYGIFAFSVLSILYTILTNPKKSLVIAISAVVVIGFLLNQYDSNYYRKNVDTNFARYFKSQYVINSENKVTVEVNQDILTALNWTENDMALLKGWFWVDQQVFSKENLIYFAENVQRTKNMQETLNTLYNEIIIKPPSVKYFLVLTLIFFFVLFNKNQSRFFLVTFINTILVLILLAFFLNLNYRVLRPVWFFLITINVLYILKETNKSNLLLTRLQRTILIPFVIIIMGVSLFVVNHQNDVNKDLRKSFSSAFAEINQHPDKTFIFRTIYEIYGFPVFLNPNEFSSKNIIITDWFTYSPVYHKILKYHNVEKDLINELISDGDFFIVNSSLLEPFLIKFYQEHYNRHICFRRSKDFQFLDVANPIDCN